MNYYETLYIVHPSLEAGRLKDIILGVGESLKKMGGAPLALELWGKRKLAYFIDKQKYGTYVLVQYNGEGKCTGEFAVELEHNPNILAYLTTCIEKENVMEQTEDLDAQIAGKSREAERRESRSPVTTVSDSPEASVKKSDSAEAAIDETTSAGDGEQTDAETETKESDTAEDKNEGETAEVEEVRADEGPVEEAEKESDTAEDKNEGETAEAEEVKADEEPVEEDENKSDEGKSADDESSTEEDTKSKQENADETAAVSEEE